MATKYATEYSKTQENPKRRMDTSYGGRLQFKTDTYALTGDLAANDVIVFGKLPAGAKVYDVIMTWTDLDNVDAAALDVGYTGTASAFHASVDVATAAGSVRFATTVGMIAIASTVDLIVTVKTDTTATSGSVILTVLYALD